MTPAWKACPGPRWSRVLTFGDPCEAADLTDEVRGRVRAQQVLAISRMMPALTVANIVNACALVIVLRPSGQFFGGSGPPGGTSGAELADALAAERPDLPVVLMSGHPGRDAVAEGAAAGQPLLRKPFGRGQLARRIAAALVAARDTPAGGQ